MKALIISSLIFFSLRAMSAEVGESLKSQCEATASTSTRSAKAVVVEDASTSSATEQKSSKSK